MDQEAVNLDALDRRDLDQENIGDGALFAPPKRLLKMRNMMQFGGSYDIYAGKQFDQEE